MRLWTDPERRRWILWGTLGVVFLLVNVNRLSSAVLSADLMVAFDTTGAQLGTLHAMFFWVYAFMQIPTGILADRVGPRRTATAGAVVMNVGVVWFAFTDTFAAALVARGLVGLGGSVIFVCILRFCANWYRADEFATMNGLTFAFSGFGGIFATTPLALAVDYGGWRPTLAILGVLGLLFAAVVFALVRDTPEKAGFEPLEGVPNQPTVSTSELRTNLATVLRDRWIWVVSVMLFCTSGVNLTMFGLWGVPYVVQTYDVSVTFASVFTLLGGLGLMIGPPAIGWLSDRLERRVELMVSGGTLVVACYGVIAVLGDPPLVVVGAAFLLAGAMLGSFLLSYAIVKDRHPASASGISTGTVNGASFFGAAILPTLMGWALDTYWTGELVGGVRVYTQFGYQLAFAIATLASVVALGCTIWIYRKERAGWTSSAFDADGDAGDSGTGDGVDVRVVDWADARSDAVAVREAVFVEEQGVDSDLERDGRDPEAIHVLATDGDEPVGTARLRPLEDGVGKVERVAVSENRRGEGIGRDLMDVLEAEAADRELEALTLHAQTHVADFYDDLGYERSSEVFEEAGIPHVEMDKRLE